MPKTPKIGSFMDDQEKALVSLIESDAYRAGTNFLDPKRHYDLREGMPHQTLINSILHKAVST